jgi:hypothetical protein
MALDGSPGDIFGSTRPAASEVVSSRQAVTIGTVAGEPLQLEKQIFGCSPLTTIQLSRSAAELEQETHSEEARAIEIIGSVEPAARCQGTP